MKLKIYQVDAFTDKLFGGNPATVIPLDKWLPDEVLQNIALENNLAETAFYIKNGGDYHIRWFTPAVEVDLCGHATLAAAHVLFNHENYKGEEIRFGSRSGILSVTKNNGLLTLDFPEDIFHEVSLNDKLHASFNIQPVKAFKGKTDYMLIFESEEEVNNLIPDFESIA